MSYISEHKTKSLLPLIKKTSTLIVGLTLLIAGGTVYILRQSSVSQTETITETIIPQITTVTALGRLEPRGEIIEVSVSSTANGNRIEELLIEEGKEVKQGEIIAVLDSRDRTEAALRQAEARVSIAQANLARVEAGAKIGEIQAQEAAIARIEAERSNDIAAQTAMVSRRSAELRNARIEYQRYQQLHDRGAISASQKDNKKLILETAQEQLTEAQANLRRIRTARQQQITEARATLNKIAEVRPVDIQVATAEVREAQAAVATALVDRDRTYIKSPQGGTVIKILTRPGEVVSSNEGIAKIGQINQMYVVAEVYESDIPKVNIGQKAVISSSAISEELTGIVEYVGLEIKRQEVVNTDPTANIDAKVVEVKVKLNEASSQKVAGLTNLLVNVKIDL